MASVVLVGLVGVTAKETVVNYAFIRQGLTIPILAEKSVRRPAPFRGMVGRTPGETAWALGHHLDVEIVRAAWDECVACWARADDFQ